MKRTSLTYLLLLLFWLSPFALFAEDGYRAWLRYEKVSNEQLLESYRSHIQSVYIKGTSPTLQAIKSELEKGLGGLLAADVHFNSAIQDGSLLVGTADELSSFFGNELEPLLQKINQEGYVIKSLQVDGKNVTVVTGKTDIGVLYGTFAFLRNLQTHKDISSLEVAEAPKIENRILNHWDNLNRLVERGYAGLSLWDWGTLPDYRDPRYTDYARLNSSMGINGTVLNNVNADPRILQDDFIEKIAVLADIFRPYGIQVYISVNFQSPMEVGNLETADPLDPDVRKWWADKASEIYDRIPDFGGFLVKADSEGEPGPFKYNRTHAEGANMLAEAVEPHGGLLIWRAFVYSPEQYDRFREAYDEFVPQDGDFNDNVLLQVKNGPIDFQPREPFSPLFGALPNTNTMLELQITQEYFGFNTHLAYQGPLFTEALNLDTYAKGEGSTVANVISGEVFDYEHTGIAGVVNLGTDRNWTGHPFVQSSWYAFGRLAWNHSLSSEEIAEEWLKMTFTNNPDFVEPVKEIMQESREAGVNYRSPLGLTHLYAQGHHYGPAPWTSDLPRPDWTAVYYHKADEDGIGFDRTETGSNAIEQYNEPLETQFSDPETTPEDYLLWFHNVSWDYEMDSGRTLWNELVHKYYKGVETVRWMQDEWNSIEGLIDKERFEKVKALLSIQEKDAVIWRNSCVLYFQSLSDKPIPEQYEKPEHDLEYYKELEKTRYIPAPRYY
ncbi:MAG: alpha-glucuronidase [Balneola sp.]|nr:alpha-glucuronidase [Balneola sp.]